MRTIRGVVAPKHSDDWSIVETRDDFLVLVQLLAREWEADEGQRRTRQAEDLWAGEGDVWRREQRALGSTPCTPGSAP
ncbi:MAG: hypothetical protein QOG69_2210 [Actinomycetota bacterium]|jgi:hypothetical protein|nr:hypothetical protein [Actinomycetota bacterium]